jgi:hypothetical protein
MFRDYGALDHNFFRFHRQENEVKDTLNFLKGDGTQQFFFSCEVVRDLFERSGFRSVGPSEGGLRYHCNRIVNRKNGKTMNKVFVNGTFRLSESSH